MPFHTAGQDVYGQFDGFFLTDDNVYPVLSGFLHIVTDDFEQHFPGLGFNGASHFMGDDIADDGYHQKGGQAENQQKDKGFSP
jgi:hypothetical protein